MKSKGVLVLSILVVLCFGLLWAYNGPAKNAAEPQDQNQALVNYLFSTNHQIDGGTANMLIANSKGNLRTNLAANSKASKVTGGTFSRRAFESILNQPGCIGIRYYFAQNNDGTPTIVLVGVNAQGQAMTSGLYMEGAAPCPPYCD